MLERLFGGTTLEGKARWYWAGQLVIMLLLFWGMTRFFFILIVFQLGPQWWDFLIILGFFILLFYLFGYGPMRKENEAQKTTSAIDFMDAEIQKGKKKPIPIMLPFRDVWELKIDYSDDSSLISKLKSQEYKNYAQTVVHAQLLPTLSKKDPQKAEEIKQLIETMIPTKKLEDKTEEDREMTIVEINEEKIHQDLKILQEKIRSSSIEKMELIPFEEFKLEEISKEPGFIKEKELLKKIKVYSVYLDREIEFDGEVWREVIVISPGNYHELLKTSKEEGGDYNGWEVNLKTCFSYWIYWRLLGQKTPVLALIFSENMVHNMLGFFTQLTASSFTYLQLKVFEQWIADLAIRPEKLKSDVQYLETRRNIFKNTLSDRVQQDAQENLIFSTFVRDEQQDKLRGLLGKHKKRFQIAIIIIIMLIILFGFLIAFLI